MIQRKIDQLVILGDEARLPLVRRLMPALYELRVDKYRLYFTFDDLEVNQGVERGIYMLTYGEKDTQTRDIQRASERL